MSALTEEAPPESFGFFVELGESSTAQERAQIAGAVRRSGGEKAIPILLGWLEKDGMPAEESPLMMTAVAKELSVLGAPLAISRLEEMADQGHLGAIQVLARYQDPATRKILERLADEADGTGRVIALAGLARHWAAGNEQRFEMALKSNPTPQLLAVAVRGLREIQGQRLPPLLLELLLGNDEVARGQAASMLEELDPGPHAEAYLGAIVATSDEKIAAKLVTSLIDHGWKDRRAIPRLAGKLSASEGDMRFRVIRLLRHLSGNAMGPTHIYEFSADHKKWVKRWQSWAADQQAEPAF